MTPAQSPTTAAHEATERFASLQRLAAHRNEQSGGFKSIQIMALQIMAEIAAEGESRP